MKGDHKSLTSIAHRQDAGDPKHIQTGLEKKRDENRKLDEEAAAFEAYQIRHESSSMIFYPIPWN